MLVSYTHVVMCCHNSFICSTVFYWWFCTLYLSSLILNDIVVVSCLLLTLAILLWTFLYMFLVHVTVAYIPGVQMVGYRDSGYTTLLNNIALFSKMARPIYVPTSRVWSFLLLHVFAIIYCCSQMFDGTLPVNAKPTFIEPPFCSTTGRLTSLLMSSSFQ